MTLFEEIQAKCTPTQINSKDHALMAELVSAGRTHLVPTEVGNGSIIETIGLTAGNDLLDILYNNASFRHIKPLLEQGRLRIDSALVRATLDSLVGNGITGGQAEALKNLAVKPDPVTAFQVAQALENGV